MDYAYSAADIIISRAGAIAISELTVVGKPVILIPSPNVAENHQYKNAQSLVNNNAALLVNDDDTNLKIVNEINKLILNKELRKNLSFNIKKLEKNQATETIFDIAKELLRDV
jgi:UDP-N-acetylglucosamine--N-acetylmuramyl-(pentapeptide) pyrophosphoryl-undecaprenol N-acetylglucosamine transferase